MPKVSVIVPNYNHARFLRRRIDSILAQTFQDFELILLDDCSTDDSRSILREYASDPRVRLEFSDANSGSTFKQWNKGVRLARGKYIWIAESDDHADERLLGRLAGLLDDDPKTVFAYCRSWRVMDDDRIDGFGDGHLETVDPRLWKSDFRMDGLRLCRSYLVRSPAVYNASAVVFRKAAYEAVGGADESMRLCGDWKLWAAMALAGGVAYVGEPLNYFRDHADNVRNKSGRDGTGVMEMLQVIRWILDRVTPAKSDLRGAREWASNHWVPLVMSFHFPLRVKLALLRRVRDIDPHPIRRVGHPAWLTFKRKLARHWRSRRSATAAVRT
jgi:glycosyltransferase involved in cell wall biosynthesis